MVGPIINDLRRPPRRATRPRKQLVLPAMRLAQFYDAVGSAAFGTEWTNGTRPLRPSTTRTDLTVSEEQAGLVADDLSFALQSRTIRAALLLDLPPMVARVALALSRNGAQGKILNIDLEGPDTEQPDSDDLLDGELIDDDEVTFTAAHEPMALRHLTRYVIDSEFWDSAWREAMDWNQSQLHVPVQFIRAVRVSSGASKKEVSYSLITYRPDLRYGPDQLLHAPVVVLGADGALSAMFSLGNVPPAEVNARYLSFRNRLIDEVVAAAWRWLAMNGGPDKPVRIGELVAAMALYLELQGIDGEANKLGDKGLEAIARQILNERSSGNCSGMALKNTRSVKPFKSASKP